MVGSGRSSDRLARTPDNYPLLQTRSNGPIASINHDDIGWSGTYYGLWADVRGAEANKVLEIGPAARPHLLEALDDPESGEEWNHLRVELNHDGTVSIDPRQQHEIVTLCRERWALSCSGLWRWPHAERTFP